MNAHQLTLDAACEALRAGKVIVFPTETFFGLGCDAMNPDAVGRVFSVKKRALTMPLPVVMAARSQLARVAARVPEAAAALMDRFWPGPLSIVLPAHDEVPDLLTANAGRIAVRLSPHPAVRELCAASEMVLVASSANVSGEASASRAEELSPGLLAGVAGLYVSGPAPEGRGPSTVVDVVQGRDGEVVRILREGVIPRAAMEEAGFAVEVPFPAC